MVWTPDKSSSVASNVTAWATRPLCETKKPLLDRAQSSKMKVTSMVTRYSFICPFLTLAFSSTT